MTLLEKKLLVPKEGAELVDALAKILQDAIEGKKLAAVLDNLSLLLQAAQGIDELPKELKSKHRDDFSAYAVKKIQEAVDKGARGDEINPNDL